MINDKLPKIWYGGDYNPEQWDAEVWAEDDRLFKLAGIDVATINVFSWAMIQPDEETYDFSSLDETMDRLYRNGTYICLATATGAHPAWMARQYPEVTRVDVKGRKRKFGDGITPTRTARSTVHFPPGLRASWRSGTKIIPRSWPGMSRMSTADTTTRAVRDGLP